MSINIPDIKISMKNIIPAILGIGLFCLAILFFFLEFEECDRILFPLVVFVIISSLIFCCLYLACKDKFISKIFLISVLMHFVFALIWQLIKYYLLGLPMPTANNFTPFISDVDGFLYHQIGVDLANNFNIDMLSDKYYGGLFPKIISCVYRFVAINPFIITLLNGFVSSFTAIFIYLIGKTVILDKEILKIYLLLCILCTSHIVNTTLLIRDAYIVFGIYSTIYFFIRFFRKFNLLYLILGLFFAYFLSLFRPYVAYITIGGIVIGYIISKIQIYKYNNKWKFNKLGLICICLLPLVVIGYSFFMNLYIANNSLISEVSVESLIHLRETAYVASNSTYSFDFTSLYHKFFLLPFIIGYLCLFLAPFPYEWIYVKRLHFVPDMLILYLILPSFIKNIRNIFKTKNQTLLICFWVMFLMFSIYCITVGNSGTIHRLRGPYIPIIYLIALYNPRGFLKRILKTIKQWRII